MAAHRHPHQHPDHEGVGRVALVPLGAAEAPLALTRALDAWRHAVAVKPCQEDLLDAGSAVFVGREVLVADAVAALRLEPRGALIPILAVVDRGGARSPWLDPAWSAAADVVLPLDATHAACAAALERLARIGAAVAQLPGGDVGRSETEKRRVRVLRFLATREIEWLEPALSATSANLFQWGSLDAICGSDVLTDLQSLEKAGLLRREFAARVFRCPCGDARLHFRDACEACRSSRLETAHTLRHRPCGHTGPSSDFWKGEELSCPSCGVELKTAGVDYDGPQDQARCAECRAFTREGLTLATCLGCGKTATAGELQAVTLDRYALTPNGKVAALASPADASSDPQRRAALVAAWRKAAAKKTAPAALVRYTGVAASGASLDSLLEEALRGSDAAVRVGGNSFLALLADTSLDGARRFVDRIALAERRLGGPGVLPLTPATLVLAFPEQAADIERAVKALE